MSHIVMRHVHKSYRTGSEEIVALNDFSLEIEAGQLVVVLGPSGSGKTTFLNILGGLEPLDRGEVEVGGKTVAGLPDAQLTAYRRQMVGFIFQFFNLLPTLTALENVTLSSSLGGSRAHDPEQMLARVGLSARLHHYPGQLSGGQQQRVAIARALAKNPALVLADEPTGSLDSETGVEVLQTMRQLNRETGQTFVVVTHNSAIAQIADQVLRIGNGRVLEAQRNPNPVEPRQLKW